MQSAMKAVTMRQFGDVDVLRMEQLPVPSPAADEVLIKVHSVSVNQTLDIAVRQGRYRTNLNFPVVLGTDPAGMVVATGESLGGHAPLPHGHQPAAQPREAGEG